MDVFWSSFGRVLVAMRLMERKLNFYAQSTQNITRKQRSPKGTSACESSNVVVSSENVRFLVWLFILFLSSYYNLQDQQPEISDRDKYKAGKLNRNYEY